MGHIIYDTGKTQVKFEFDNILTSLGTITTELPKLWGQEFIKSCKEIYLPEITTLAGTNMLGYEFEQIEGESIDYVSINLPNVTSIKDLSYANFYQSSTKPSNRIFDFNFPNLVDFSFQGNYGTQTPNWFFFNVPLRNVNLNYAALNNQLVEMIGFFSNSSLNVYANFNNIFDNITKISYVNQDWASENPNFDVVLPERLFFVNKNSETPLLIYPNAFRNTKVSGRLRGYQFHSESFLNTLITYVEPDQSYMGDLPFSIGVSAFRNTPCTLLETIPNNIWCLFQRNAFRKSNIGKKLTIGYMTYNNQYINDFNRGTFAECLNLEELTIGSNQYDKALGNMEIGYLTEENCRPLQGSINLKKITLYVKSEYYNTYLTESPFGADRNMDDSLNGNNPIVTIISV